MSAKVSVRLPNNSQQAMIVGRNGTGKTTAGIWLLSTMISPKVLDKSAWVLFNAKREILINEIGKIPGVHTISLNEMPAKKGISIVNATPNQMSSDAMELFLARIHARGNTGLFFDEGYAFDPRSDMLKNIYTQGRSLRIPCITLSQRPSWISRFALSEATFYMVFPLNDADDRKSVKRFAPLDMDTRLPDYHSWWYDVGKNNVAEFSPVPPADIILDKFDTSIRPPKLVI
jgi:hypothetical protein